LHSDEFAANIVFMPIGQLVKLKIRQKIPGWPETSDERIIKKAVFRNGKRYYCLFNKQNNIFPIKKLNVKA
jgi:hypothetical protein